MCGVGLKYKCIQLNITCSGIARQMFALFMRLLLELRSAYDSRKTLCHFYLSTIQPLYVVLSNYSFLSTLIYNENILSRYSITAAFMLEWHYLGMCYTYDVGLWISMRTVENHCSEEDEVTWLNHRTHCGRDKDPYTLHSTGTCVTKHISRIECNTNPGWYCFQFLFIKDLIRWLTTVLLLSCRHWSSPEWNTMSSDVSWIGCGISVHDCWGEPTVYGSCIAMMRRARPF